MIPAIYPGIKEISLISVHSYKGKKHSLSFALVEKILADISPDKRAKRAGTFLFIHLSM